jgi:hypothetical protein
LSGRCPIPSSSLLTFRVKRWMYATQSSSSTHGGMPLSFTCRGARWTKRPFEHLPAQAIRLRMTPGFLFLYIVSISVVLLFDMYYMYWASADVFMHACTETRRSGWHRFRFCDLPIFRQLLDQNQLLVV